MRNQMVVVEGSYAVAHAVKVCKPQVISAYPITPQTHIVEDLSQFAADGEMNCAYMNVESEFSAISALIASQIRQSSALLNVMRRSGTRR